MRKLLLLLSLVAVVLADHLLRHRAQDLMDIKSNCARPPRPKGRGMLRAARPVFRNSEIIQS